MTTTGVERADTERRLEAALHARAELVQPEVLKGFEPLSASTAHHPRWRRVTTYAAALAACTAAVVGTYALSHDRSVPEPAPAPEGPDGWVGGLGRSGPGAQLAGSRQTADLDADGRVDTVWVRSPGDREGPVRVEALLSSKPDQVIWTVLDLRSQTAGLESALQLDDDPGEELVVNAEDGETFELTVVDLVDGRLQQVPSASGGPLTRTELADGRVTSARVVDGRLLSWTSQEPMSDEARYIRTDATWWVIGEVAGERRLTPAEQDEVCMDTYDGLVGACLAGNRPDAQQREMGEDNPYDYVPDLLPTVARQLDLGQFLSFDLAGETAQARLTGDPGAPVLEVEIDGETLSADLGAGDPVRLLNGVVPGKAGPGLLVLRESGDGTSWSVWSVRDGSLSRVLVSDEAPFGSGFREGGATGLQDYRTELSRSGLLYTSIGGVAEDPAVRDVWIWTLDEGPGVVARGWSCFRFPDDGSDPTFAAC